MGSAQARFGSQVLASAGLVDWLLSRSDLSLELRLGCALLRFGLPLDLSFLIVAVVAIVISLILVRSGVGTLKPSRLVPAKSISQISSLLRFEVVSSDCRASTLAPICARSRLACVPQKQPHALAWPIFHGVARLTMRANGIRSPPRSSALGLPYGRWRRSRIAADANISHLWPRL